MKTDDYGWSDAAPPSRGYLEPVILGLARKYGARTVLDVGCGNGFIAERLAEEGFQVTAMDADAQGIAIAKSRSQQVDFRVGSIEDRPDEQYDFVYSTEVVEHLYSPQHLARYCYEATAPEGRLAISTPYHGYWKNLALSLVDKWDSHHTALWHGGHIKFWSRRTLTQLLEGAGFDVVDFIGVGRLPYLWKSMVLVGRKGR